MIPTDLKYTEEHEWVQVGGDLEDGVVRVGITDHAQDALGDIVFVELPAEGTAVTAGEVCGEVESTKSVSELFAPVTGEVVRRNDELDGAPEVINTDPYGKGWMFEVKVADPTQIDGLLDAAEYDQRVAS